MIITPEILNGLRESRGIDIADCRSVCLMMGPYRNLTTLTAATLFLHPNCQVLNHGKDRVFGIEEVDFLSDFSIERFNRFIQYAIYISRSGKRGWYGGTITVSHAFDSQYATSELFHQSGLELVKKKIVCLLWKESLEISNKIKLSQFDFHAVFKKENRIRFMMPIRNPLDCAASSIKTGHSKHFLNIQRSDVLEDVLQAVLEEILWFKTLHSQFPNRFYYFFEHTISKSTCNDLANFLELSLQEDWINRALQGFTCSSNYQYFPSQLDFFIDSVKKKFIDYPRFADQLLIFADLTQKRGFLQE